MKNTSIQATATWYEATFPKDPMLCMRTHINNVLKKRRRHDSSVAEFPYSSLWFLIWAEQRITELEKKHAIRITANDDHQGHRQGLPTSLERLIAARRPDGAVQRDEGPAG